MEGIRRDFMPTIELSRIANFICQDVNLKIFDGEAMAIWGATGAGKTTLLNIIAGLIGYQGEVLFDGKAMEGIPPSRRGGLSIPKFSSISPP
jgi:ABC-type sugar transport system ATPase subunit